MTTNTLMSTTQVKQLLGRSRQTVCRWSRVGLIPAIRMPDDNYAYDRTVIGAWMKERRTR